MKRQSGITLVALIITIIVMIILAGVAIAVAVGDGGVINKAQTATDSQKYQTVKEQVQAQCVYVAEGENVGKVNLNQTLDNVKNLKLEEIDYTEGKTGIEGNSLKVTLKNGEVITIDGISNNGKKQYYSYYGEVFVVDWTNNIIDWYTPTEDGKYEMVMSSIMVSLSENKEINVDGNTITLDENVKVVYSNMVDGGIMGYVLPEKAYVMSGNDYNIFVEIFPEEQFPDISILVPNEENFYEAIKNGTIDVGWNDSVIGYTANGYSNWVIFDITSSGNVRIIPNKDVWNLTYKYEIEKDNQYNLGNVKNICDKYLNSEYATEVNLPDSAEAYAAYIAVRGSGYGMCYATNSSDELIGANATGAGGNKKEFEITSAVEYTVLPIITLDKDVKVTGGSAGLRIYK